MTQFLNKFNIESLTEKEKIALFGEPTKFYKNLGILKKKEAGSEVADEQEKEQNFDEIFDIMEKSSQKTNKIWLQRFVIDVNNTYKSLFDVMILLLIVYNVFMIQLHLIKKLNELHSMSLLKYALDQIQSSVSSMLIRILKHLKIMIVFRTWFFIDFIAIIPFAEIIGDDGQWIKLVRILRMPKFLRLLDVSKIDQVLETILQNTSQKEKMHYLYLARYIYKILRLIIIAITLAYFISCIWYAIATAGFNDDGESFADAYEIRDNSDFHKLIICLYFTMTTLTTVGYGDYSPQTNTEKVFGILIMILGIAFFSYIMGNFNDVLTNYEKKMNANNQESELQQWITSLEKFTSNKSLPKNLQARIDEHFKFFWKHDRLAGLTLQDKYLQIMPKPLRHEVIKYLFEDIFLLFRGFLLIKEFPKSNFFYELAFELLPRKYNQGEIILKQFQEVEEMYLVLEGEVKLSFTYNYNDEKSIEVSRFFKRGYYFGNPNLFNAFPSEFTYTAMTFVKAISLPKHRLLMLLDKYPTIKTRMMDYTIQLQRQTQKALSYAFKNSLKEQLSLEIDNKEAKKLFYEYLNSVRKEIQPNVNFKVHTDMEEIPLSLVKDKLDLLGSKMTILQEKVDQVKNGFLDEFDSIAKKVESIKKRILEDDQNY